jgi:hypothetical protein
MTRTAMTLAQAQALKPGDKFRDLNDGHVEIVVNKDSVGGYMEPAYTWSVPEGMFKDVGQHADAIYRYDEMAAFND